MTTTQPSDTSPLRLSAVRHSTIVLLLAIVGGSVDATVILGFGVLTAAQTGNTILLAVSLIQHRFAAGLHSAVSVAGYVTGAALGELMMVRKRESGTSMGAIRVRLAAEFTALTCLLLLWHSSFVKPAFGPAALFVGLAAIAMGIQSATVLDFHSGPKTTYITGTLTNFTTKAIRWFRFLETSPMASPARQHHGSSRSQATDRPWIYGASWAVYASAAALGGFLFLRIHELTLLLPMAAILSAIVVGIGVKQG